jgi:hypothetical protein
MINSLNGWKHYILYIADFRAGSIRQNEKEMRVTIGGLLHTGKYLKNN